LYNQLTMRLGLKLQSHKHASMIHHYEACHKRMFTQNPSLWTLPSSRTSNCVPQHVHWKSASHHTIANHVSHLCNFKTAHIRHYETRPHVRPNIFKKPYHTSKRRLDLILCDTLAAPSLLSGHTGTTFTLTSGFYDREGNSSIAITTHECQHTTPSSLNQLPVKNLDTISSVTATAITDTNIA
jgi:hypothetical protein